MRAQLRLHLLLWFPTLLAAACGPPPRPVGGAGPIAAAEDPHAGHDHPPGEHPPGEEQREPRDPHAGHDHPPGEHPEEPAATENPHAAGAGPDAAAAGLTLGGALVLAPELDDVTSGRLFLFAWDAATRSLVLNRAYEVGEAPFTPSAGGGRRLPFELDARDYMGGPVDGPFRLEVRLDADGEILTTEDVVARQQWDVEAGAADLALRLEAPGG